MRRRLSILVPAVAVSLVGLGVTGCVGKLAQGPTVNLAQPERVRVSGSGTALPLVRLLTEAYPDKSLAFVYLPGLHSAGGIQGVVQGDLKIGTVSRDLTPEEQKLGLKQTWLSNDGLIIATHGDAGISALTSAQVRGIYAGTYTNWKQLGGASLPITVLDRNEDESAKIILREYVLGPVGKFTVTPRAIKLYYEPDMVQGLTSTPGAVGYFSLGYAISERVPVTRMKLDGVEPTLENVMSGKYRVVRPLGVVTHPNADARVSAFLKWAAGSQAAGVMKQKGYAPLHR